ncbi:DUF4785 domain-containing protein [Stenotrophomonas sp. 24(2023)]|uniref:DUF4785 domain-containing protein n=1 Tax=Stenotrophomonas sp. 24(2023) TaxID=3068324 RepID=UPI0027E10D0B|nr:DUF4785 domain-containing protein [Stenotrophomonas sp. 24(2023)]WMJ71136.1 DUF4785 domain-containing protein [Stenotrophomonas sp. 24(2023)]
MTMTLILIKTIPALSALALLVALHAASVQAAQPLQASRAGDQVPAALVNAPLPADGNDERQPLAFAWALDPAQPVTAGVPFTDVSRSYWQQVDGAALQRGLDLPLTAPDAVIQLSPAPDARALPASQLQVRDPAGRVGQARAVEAADLQAAGMPVTTGSTMLRTGADSPAGAYRLQSAQAQGRYVVQVLEPDSPVRLQVQPGRMQVLAGERLPVQVTLADERARATALASRRRSLGGQALLVAPDGRTWPQALRPGANGGLSAQVQIPADSGAVQGLWELQVFTQADGVLRDGKVAFAVARPTARFAGQATADAGTRRVALPVQVAAAGRYEARGTLYATAGDGQLRPVAQAHAAAWFGHAGRGELVLPFDQAALPSGYGAPYELRHLQLQDQSRMAPIESRGQALRF